MSVLETLILGLVQGLTEFLPVSSSGHLVLVKAIFGSDYKQKQGLMITIILHTATALSTLFVFRKDIALILLDLLNQLVAQLMALRLQMLVLDILMEHLLMFLYTQLLVMERTAKQV